MEEAQGVEYIHWRNQVTEALRALAAKLGTVIGGGIRRVRNLSGILGFWWLRFDRLRA